MTYNGDSNSVTFQKVGAEEIYKMTVDPSHKPIYPTFAFNRQ